jgi:hypothetical protein
MTFSNSFQAISANFYHSRLSQKEKGIYTRIKLEIKQYLTEDGINHTLQLILISFNDTANLGMDESIPLLKAVFSFIRRRLTKGNTHEYKKLIQLLDSFNRSCGLRAQVLIGREKFLQTLSKMARKYSNNPLPICQECASITLDCLQAWSEAFSKYKTVFPYYEPIYLNLKSNYKFTFPLPEKDKSLVPIPIDISLLADKFPSISHGEDTSESDGGDDHFPTDSYTSENLGEICYTSRRFSDHFWGFPPLCIHH